jgi:anti-anti-sigma factor
MTTTMTKNGLTTAISRDGDTHVLTLSGQIDMVSSPQFGVAAVSLGGEDIDLVFDMTHVTFMDSSGLSIIAGTLRRLERTGGKLCIRNPQLHVRRVLETVGLSSYLIID